MIVKVPFVFIKLKVNIQYNIVLTNKVDTKHVCVSHLTHLMYCNIHIHLHHPMPDILTQKRAFTKFTQNLQIPKRDFQGLPTAPYLQNLHVHTRRIFLVLPNTNQSQSTINTTKKNSSNEHPNKTLHETHAIMGRRIVNLIIIG